MNLFVSYACNEAYIEQTSVSMVSLFENNKEHEVVVYFIDMGISDKSKNYLYNIAGRYGQNLVIVDFKNIAYDLKIGNTGRHIESVYAKFFFDRLPIEEKILYLDSDIVVVDSLSELWNTNIDGYYCAGVETIHSEKDNLAFELEKEARAINDGMVLINLQLWRKDNMLKRCLDFIDRYNGNPPVLSEGTINAVCHPFIKIIHPRYNLMSGIVGGSSNKIKTLTSREYYPQNVLDEAIKKPCIVHFLSGFYNRPWCKRCSHPLKSYYLKYRNMTKWRDVPLQEKDISFRLKFIGFLYEYLPIELFVLIRHIFGK